MQYDISAKPLSPCPGGPATPEGAGGLVEALRVREKLCGRSGGATCPTLLV